MTPSGELERGDTLGRYEIVRKLATGGMAEIYLARMRGIAGFEKQVVIKWIPPRLAVDQRLVTMFLEEAKLAATLRHPNIASVLDVGVGGTTFFFAMEYVYGQDARAIRLKAQSVGQPIPYPIATAIGCGVIAGLAHAHDSAGPSGPLQLIHRDVSPSNILVGYDGAVKLVDFGIARATGRTTQTQTGTLKGKLAYMSPEQCRNFPLDRRSDLFSLGIVLYELTTGTRPFGGKSDFELLESIVRGVVTPPSAVVRSYPPALERIVMRLLQPRPEDRYQNGEAVLVDLEAFAAEVALTPSTIVKYMRELFGAELAADAARRTGTIEIALPEDVESAAEATRVTPKSQPGSKPATRATPPSGQAVVKPTTRSTPPSGQPVIKRPESPRPATTTEPTQLFGGRPSSEPARAPTTITKPVLAPPPPQSFDFDTVRGGPADVEVTNPALAKDDLDEETRRLGPVSKTFATVEFKYKTDPIGLDTEEATQADRSLLADTDLLAELAADARPDETLDQRIRRRITTLLERAFIASAVGEHERAVAAIELALSEPDLPQARKIIDEHRAAIERTFEAFIGDLDRRPRLARSLDVIGKESLTREAAHVLARVDGRRSIRDLLSDPTLQPLAAYRAVARLIRAEAFE